MKRHFGKYLGPTLIDEAQPITAWRTWKLREDLGRIRLVGTWATGFTWATKAVTVAECLAGDKGSGSSKGAKGSRCNATMDPACHCGLWATVALSNLLTHGAVALYPAGVLGRVHLWGFVHVYEFGFRASMGRPVECWLGNSDGQRDAGRLQAEYAIPVGLGLPVEIVVDPGLLTPRKVLAAARTYMAAQEEQLRALPPAPPPAPLPAEPARQYLPKRIVHHCRGCGKPGRIDRCPDCKVKV